MDLSDLNRIQYFLHEKYFPLINAQDELKENENHNDLKIDEFFVQKIWNEKLFDNNLNSYKDEKIQIIFKGRWNSEEGPDFKEAIILKNGEKIIGDIEIHLTPQAWIAHGHQGDAKYNNVILHIVWEAPQNQQIPPNIPMVILKKHLKKPILTILEELHSKNYPYAEKIKPLISAKKFSSMSDNQLIDYVNAAALLRFQQKTLQAKTSIMLKGLEQALFENFFEALGYKSNKQAFINLAEKLQLKSFDDYHKNKDKSAIIWGKSGLLPDLTLQEIHPELHGFVNDTWRIWGKYQASINDINEWSFRGRPANSPYRRLAAGIGILEKYDYQPSLILEEIFKTIKNKNSTKLLLNIFNIKSNIWSNFINLKTKNRTKIKLLGQSRIIDLLINVFLPYAAAIKSQESNLVSKIEQSFFQLPKTQQNAIVKDAENRFFIPPSRIRLLVKNAAGQQGLMQMYKDLNWEKNIELHGVY